MEVERIKGLAFPFKIGHRGHLDRAEGIEKLKVNLRTIALTAVRERPMRPDFGTVGYSRLFRGMDATAETAIKDLVERAIVTYEPRVRVHMVNIELDEDSGRATIKMSFSDRRSGELDETSVIVDRGT